MVTDQVRRAPERLTDLDRHYDALMRFENFDRYRQQSANTRDGSRADPPARPSIKPIHARAPQ